MKPGTIVGNRYRLDHLIGSGPTGVVWRAFDELLEREVTVKVLHELLGSEPALRRLFRNNALAASPLQHPGICQLFDSNEETLPDGTSISYIVTEYLAARPLSAMVARRPLDAHRVLPIIAAAAQAVNAAHDAGVVHGNLKPQNILVGDDDTVVVVDFGTVAGAVGPLAYQSPEQRQSMPLTPASDVYSLGAIAYECLTGQSPGPDGARLALLPDGTSSAVVELLTRTLDPEPTKRFANAELLAAECVQIDYASAVLGSLLTSSASNPTKTATTAADPIEPVMVAVPRKPVPTKTNGTKNTRDEETEPPAEIRSLSGLLLVAVAAIALGVIAAGVAFWPWDFAPTGADNGHVNAANGVDASVSDDSASASPKDPSSSPSSLPMTQSPSSTPKPSAKPTVKPSPKPPDQVPVPNVLGMERRDARNELVPLGFGVTVTWSGYGELECPVHDQSPEAETVVDEGSMVTIVVLLVDDLNDCGDGGVDPTEPTPSPDTGDDETDQEPSTPTARDRRQLFV